MSTNTDCKLTGAFILFYNMCVVNMDGFLEEKQFTNENVKRANV